jgi:integrase
VASIYLRSAKHKTYSMEFKDQHGRTRTNVSTGQKDRKNAESLLHKVQDDADRIRAGKEPIFPEITGPFLGLAPVVTTGKPWREFVKEYEARTLAGLAKGTRLLALYCLARFQAEMKLSAVNAINADTIADFVVALRKRRGRHKDETASPATINRTLRHVKAALGLAVEWGYLAAIPKFRFEKQPRDLPRYVTPEHFAAIYQACDLAHKPAGLAYPPSTWWRALLMLIYCGTGWRISQTLALRQDSLTLEGNPTVESTAEQTKGKRGAKSALPPIAVEHLRPLVGACELDFPWPHHRRTLDEEWADIQEAASVPGPDGKPLPFRLPCRKQHAHTRHCHLYTFHDLRRGFATMNADRLDPLELQQQMQHKTFATTQGYINTSRLLQPTASKLFVPTLSLPQTT